MKRNMVCGLLALSLSLTAALPVRADEALEAYSRGDYAAAFRIWLPLAEQHNADAQYALAVLFTKGEGVPKDAAQAAMWFRKAADQGHASAQYSLGLRYVKGEGVPKDQSLAAA